MSPKEPSLKDGSHSLYLACGPAIATEILNDFYKDDLAFKPSKYEAHAAHIAQFVAVVGDRHNLPAPFHLIANLASMQRMPVARQQLCKEPAFQGGGANATSKQKSSGAALHVVSRPPPSSN